MVRSCHRCHAELPGPPPGNGAYGSSASDDERTLFCPRCGAPQILLPEYMRSEAAPALDSVTTGTHPPPRPQLIEWRILLLCIAPVALATAIFTTLAQVAPQTSFLSTFCILAGSGIVLALYRARRPLARTDGKVGLRVGLVTGLAMVTLMGLGLASIGILARFTFHTMTPFDDQMRKQQTQVMDAVYQITGHQPTPQERQSAAGYMTSPEIIAGNALVSLATVSGFILLLTTLGGGLAGMLQARRRGLGRRL